MKPSIHPKYFATTVHCAGCNTDFVTGSTIPSMRVDICANCHPFYTGQKKLIDTEGRVERFARRSANKTEVRKPRKAAPQPTYTAPRTQAKQSAAETVVPTGPKSLRDMLQEAANSSN